MSNALRDFVVGTAQEHLEGVVAPEVLEAFVRAEGALAGDGAARAAFDEEMERVMEAADLDAAPFEDDPYLLMWFLGLIFLNATLRAAEVAALVTGDMETRWALDRLEVCLRDHPDTGMAVMSSSAHGLSELRRNPAIVIVSEGHTPENGWSPSEAGEG